MKNNNKLIAEFMGYEVKHNKCYSPKYNDGTIAPMQFHKSWDWLMPVISKCAILNNEEGFEPFKDICELKLHSEHPTYQEVIRFIKHYNQTKNVTS